MTKKCEHCGKEFECLHNEKCWCLNYTVSKKLADYFKANFKDCLCEDCLKWHIENEEIVLKSKRK